MRRIQKNQQEYRNEYDQRENRNSYKRKRKKRKRFHAIIRMLVYSILAVVFCISLVKIAKVMIFSYGYEKRDSNPAIDDKGTKTEVKKDSKGYIVIDPGHGGENSPGCSYGGLLERDITLELGLQLKDDLIQKGYTVLMTREEDKSVELLDRAIIANDSDADLFISLHLNAHDNTTVSGIETWFNPNSNSKNSELAEIVQNSITSTTNAKDRGTYTNTTLIVTREVLIPSCLVEVGYLSNTKDRENLMNPAYRQKLMQGITDGIDQYLKQYNSNKTTKNDDKGSIKNGNNTTKDGNDTTKGGNDTTKGGNDTTKDDNDTTKDGNDTTKDDNDTTKGGNGTVKDGTEVKHTSNDKKDKIVYLTFDDGPSNNTEKVLDILDQYNIKASFFVTGLNKGYFPLIKEANRRGHTIGLHTYTHDYKKIYSSEKAFFKDMKEIGSVVKGQIGYEPKYIRFAGGASNLVSKKFNKGIMSRLVKQVSKKGYRYFDWDISSGDASTNTTTESIVNNATSCHWSKITLLFHDATGKQTTVEALPQIIETYKQRGYRFEALSNKTIPVHHKTIN